MNGPSNDNGQQDEKGQPPLALIPMPQFQQAMFNFITSSTVYQENTSAILNIMNTRLENVETRLENVEIQLENVDTRLESMDTRLENLEAGLIEVKEVLKSFGTSIVQADSLEEVKEGARKLAQQLSTQNQ